MKNNFKDINNIDIDAINKEIEKENHISDITSETLIGWSNICFNDTLDYYHDCHNHNK